MMSTQVYGSVTLGVTTTAAVAQAPVFGSTGTNGNALLLVTPGLAGHVRGFGITIVTATTVTSRDPILSCKVFVSPGVSTNARTVDTLTFNAHATTGGGTAGNTLMNMNCRSSDTDNTFVDAGEQIVVEVTTIGDGNGAGTPFVIFEPIALAALGEATTRSKTASNSVGTIITKTA